jgi:serine-type D-Ala-D-Ala endopeptidase (penicillin-binding protein 7)
VNQISIGQRESSGIGHFLRRRLSILLGLAFVAFPLVIPATAGATSTKGASSAKVRPAAAPQRASAPKAAPIPAAANRKRAPAASSAQRRAPAPKAASTAPRRTAAAAPVAQRVSIGQAIGLHLVDDPLELKSSVALVVDQQTGEVLFQKNPRAVLPIASITKVMTSIVVLDAGQPLDEILTITDADRDLERHSSSRLHVGAQLTRREMLQLALMASENRAASALGRNYPGGFAAFVDAMNAKSRELQMTDTHFADATGLSGRNVSNARDLATMVRAAYEYPDIRHFSTALNLNVAPSPKRTVAFRSTNRLVDAADWSIGLQKTGYISEAGRCLVMQAHIRNRDVIIVLLDSAGSHYRAGDAQRIRDWLQTQPHGEAASADIDDNDVQS